MTKKKRSTSKSKVRSTNTLGYTGVRKHQSSYTGCFTFSAQYKIGDKTTNCGTYDTAKEAAIARDHAVFNTLQQRSGRGQSQIVFNFPNMVHNLGVKPKRPQQKLISTNTTGYRGVTLRASGRFESYLNGLSNGMYDTAIAAALAFDQAAIKAGRKSYILNFPDQATKHAPISINAPSNLDLHESTRFYPPSFFHNYFATVHLSCIGIHDATFHPVDYVLDKSFNAFNVFNEKQRAVGYDCDTLMDQHPYDATLYNNTTDNLSATSSSKK